MGQRLLSGPRVALFLAVVQWLVAALFQDRFELMYTVVPVSTVTVVAAEAGLLLRADARVSEAPRALAQSLWCFLIAILGFAVVSFLAAGRSQTPSPDMWRGWEWAVTLAVVAYVTVTWFRVERLRQHEQ